MISNSNNLIWLDLEMTGLDPDIHKILEIAVVITDSNLNIINIGPELVIYQPDKILDSMDEWNTKQHHKSGLIARVKADGISITAAEKIMLDYLKQYVPAGVSPMCGNSIYQDRRFLCQYMQTGPRPRPYTRPGHCAWSCRFRPAAPPTCLHVSTRNA